MTSWGYERRPENTILDKFRNRWASFRYWTSQSTAYWGMLGLCMLLGAEILALAVWLAGEERFMIPCTVMGVVLLLWAIILWWRWRRWYIRENLRSGIENITLL